MTLNWENAEALQSIADRRIACLDIRNKTQLATLIALLGKSSYNSKEIASISDSDILPPIQVLNISDQLILLGAVTAVIQFNLRDQDYYQEYEWYYSKTFPHHSRLCNRIHFFSTPKSADEDAFNFLKNAKNKSYLGFVTVRPIEQRQIGASVIAWQGGSGGYLTVKEKFNVHIAGREFTVEGAPYIQQDGAAGSCSQAALWMALRVRSKKDRKQAQSVPHITDAMQKYMVYGRVTPNRSGMTINQLLGALHFFEYHPIYLDIATQFTSRRKRDLALAYSNVKRMLYPYIESGYPILLVFESDANASQHAALLVGHGWKKHSREKSTTTINLGESGKSIQLVHPSRWIDNFIFHNDNHSPYQILKETGEEYSLETLRYAIPILPNFIYMNAAEAEEVALKYFNSVTSALMASEIVCDEFCQRKLVYRTTLEPRHHLRTQAINLHDESLARYYTGKSYPDYVWITRFYDLRSYLRTDIEKNVPTGEVVIDPSSDPAALPVLTLRVKYSNALEVLADNDPVSGQGVSMFARKLEN